MQTFAKVRANFLQSCALFFQKYLFRVGGACVLHARADFEKGSVREWLITDQAPSVVEHAAHEKPEACEISSPHQL